VDVLAIPLIGTKNMNRIKTDTYRFILFYL